MTTLKIKALAEFVGCEVEDIEEGYREDIFEVGSKEYLVLTDAEADKQVAEYILDSLWAFNSSFIQAHSNLNDLAINALHRAQEELCEDSNELVRGIIKDLNHFVNDAVSADGRGHFLSPYDGEENEEKIGDNWFFIYRQN